MNVTAQPDTLHTGHHDACLAIMDMLKRIALPVARNTILYHACDDHLRSGGSLTRALLCYDIATALEISRDDALLLACIPELLHQASLIHDDIQDHDTTRRGAPSCWSRVGTEQAICAGDWCIIAAYRALAVLSSSHKPTMLEIVNHYSAATITGQSYDLAWSRHASADDHDTYIDIAVQKSGSLLTLAGVLPCIAAGMSDYVGPIKAFMAYFAVAYQMIDDIADIEEDRCIAADDAAIREMVCNRVLMYEWRGMTEPVDIVAVQVRECLREAETCIACLPETVMQIFLRRIEALRRQLLTVLSDYAESVAI